MARSAQIPRFALALFGYTLLALLLFHGLFGRFSTAVPHDLGDPLLSTWILWWNAERLPFVGAWWDGLSFFPGHGSLAFSDHRVGTALIAEPHPVAGRHGGRWPTTSSSCPPSCCARWQPMR